MRYLWINHVRRGIRNNSVRGQNRNVVLKWDKWVNEDRTLKDFKVSTLLFVVGGSSFLSRSKNKIDYAKN